MNPVTLGVLAAATALSGAGSIMGSGDAARRARDTARARNAVLNTSLAKIDANTAENKAAFDARMGDYAPGVQGNALQAAQDARVTGNTGAMTAGDAGDVALSGSAPAVVRGAIAKRMLEAFQGARQRAEASGKLGGYGDVWMNNRFGISDTANKIGTVNNFAAGQGRITGALQDLTEQASYRPPALLPQVLQFAGSVLGGAAGRGMFGGATPAVNPGVAGGGYLGAGGQIFPGPGRY